MTANRADQEQQVHLLGRGEPLRQPGPGAGQVQHRERDGQDQGHLG